MTALYLTLLVLGLAVFVLAMFSGFDHDVHFDFAHDFHFDFAGHHFDFGHHDVGSSTDSPGLFSIRTISALFAGFGVSGLLAKLVLDWGIGGQLLLGFGTGFVLAALAYLIMWAMYTQQAGAVKDSSQLVGRNAVVTTGTGSQGIGECRVDNLYYTFREKTSKDAHLNEIVKVVESQPGLLIVEKQ